MSNLSPPPPSLSTVVSKVVLNPYFKVLWVFGPPSPALSLYTPFRGLSHNFGLKRMLLAYSILQCLEIVENGGNDDTFHAWLFRSYMHFH